jgi:hypothetical protein
MGQTFGVSFLHGLESVVGNVVKRNVRVGTLRAVPPP